MKQTLNIMLVYIITTTHTVAGMDLEAHKNVFRRVQPSTPEGITKVTEAIAYIKEHGAQDPQQDRWLKICDTIQRTVIPFMQNEIQFNELLRDEVTQPNQSRWPLIAPLLEQVSCYTLDNNEPFIEDLTTLRDDPEASYEKWLAILKKHNGVVTTIAEITKPDLPPLPYKNLQIIPLLQSLPALESPQALKDQPSTEPITQQKKKITKKKKKKQKEEETTEKHTAPVQQAVSPQSRSINSQAQKEALHNLFWTALVENNTNTVCALLTANAGKIDINATHSNASISPLIAAVSNGREAMSQLLLEHGANPDATSTIKLPAKQGWLKLTPLIMAIRYGYPQLVRILLDHNADPNVASVRIPSRKEEHALCAAAETLSKRRKKSADTQEQEEIIKLLLAQGAKEYCGTISFFDTAKGNRYRLQLNNPIHKKLLPRLIAGTITITVSGNNMVLTGSPVLHTEQSTQEKPTEESSVGTSDVSLASSEIGSK